MANGNSVSRKAEEIKNMPHDKLVKEIWENLKDTPTSKWQWMMLNMHWDDIYGGLLSETEYFEIAKFAVQHWAAEEGGRVHAKALTPEHYYEVCKIMATQGVFKNLDYDVLQSANIKGIKNPVNDVVRTALNKVDVATRSYIFNWLETNDIYAAFIAHKMKGMEQNLKERISNSIE